MTVRHLKIKLIIFVVFITLSLSQLISDCNTGCTTSCETSCNTSSSYSDNQTGLKPHASIIKWMPGSYGNYPGISHQKRPLPIYITVSFDKQVTDVLFNNYINFLKQHFNQVSGTRNKGEISFTTPGNTPREHVNSILIQANRHFDPEFKTQEEIAAIEAAKRKEEETLLRINQEKILRQQIADAQLKREAEEKEKEARKIIALAAAEKARKEYEEQRKKEEDEQSRKELEEPKDCNNYKVITLRSDFRTLGSHCLNEKGQIAGFLCNNNDMRAAVFEIDGTYKTFPLDGSSKALAINENGEVAIEYIKFMPHETKQVVLWNIYTNAIIWGPMGSPKDMNNNGKILIWNERQAKIWNIRDNTIADLKSNPYMYYIDEQDTCYSHASDVNKKGSILSQNMEVSLSVNGIKNVVGFQECFDFKMVVNSNNEVAAIVYKRDFNKTTTRIEDRIAIWRKNSPINYSKPFKYIAELKTQSNWEIDGFNKLGQVLLSRSGVNKQWFLLIPKN